MDKGAAKAERGTPAPRGVVVCSMPSAEREYMFPPTSIRKTGRIFCFNTAKCFAT